MTDVVQKIIYFFTLLVIISGCLVSNKVVFAASGPEINTLTNKIADVSGYDITTNEKSFSLMVGGVIKAVLSLTGTVFFALTVYAGILWMTAAGNEERHTKAKKIFQTSTIGLVIIVVAYSITAFVMAMAFSAAATNTGSTVDSKTMMDKFSK